MLWCKLLEIVTSNSCQLSHHQCRDDLLDLNQMLMKWWFRLRVESQKSTCRRLPRRSLQYIDLVEIPRHVWEPQECLVWLEGVCGWDELLISCSLSQHIPTVACHKSAGHPDLEISECTRLQQDNSWLYLLTALQWINMQQIVSLTG